MGPPGGRSGSVTRVPLKVDDCERVVQDMGFPYIHFLHTYYYG